MRRSNIAVRSRIALGVMTGLLACSPAANAGEPAYPAKPIRWVVPFLPSGGADTVSRAVAQKLSDAWGATVVIDNRSGATGLIGAELAAKSPADGYTLLTITSSHSVAMIRPKLRVDLARDFAPITQMTSQPYVIAVPVSLPVKDVPQLIELARKKPNHLNYGSSGVGGLQHLAWALFSSMAGVQMVHIPYKGGGNVHTELLAGNIQLGVVSPLTTHELVKNGRIRYLAVTSVKRLKAFPDIPTVSESGLKGYEIDGWYGVAAPRGTPPEVVARLNREIVRTLTLPDVSTRFEAGGFDPVGNSAAEFGTHIRTEIEKWKKLAKETGIKLDN